MRTIVEFVRAQAQKIMGIHFWSIVIYESGVARDFGGEQ